jgi:hypothetical protein
LEARHKRHGIICVRTSPDNRTATRQKTTQSRSHMLVIIHPQLLFEGYPILETQQNSSRSRLFLDSRLFKGRARMATWTSRQSCITGTSAGGRHFYAAPSLRVGPVFEGPIVSHVQKQYRRQLPRSDPSVTKISWRSG